MKLKQLARRVETDVEETLSYMDFPHEHWSKLRTDNGIEHAMREIRRRTRVVGVFPDGNSAMMPAGAKLKYISTTEWGTRPYMDICKLHERDVK